MNNHKIVIDIDSQTFSDGEGMPFNNGGVEVARILRDLAEKLENSGLCKFVLKDRNDNKVGLAKPAKQNERN